jgi:hypothetical protein
MTQVRNTSRLTSIVVVLALVAVAMVGLPCVAVGSPMTGEMPTGHGACAVDEHGALTAVAASADDSARANKSASTAPPAGIDSQTPIVRTVLVAVVSAELPSPADPRHGRTIV